MPVASTIPQQILILIQHYPHYRRPRNAFTLSAFKILKQLQLKHGDFNVTYLLHISFLVQSTHKIMYQNFKVACSEVHFPRVIHGTKMLYIPARDSIAPFLQHFQQSSTSRHIFWSLKDLKCFKTEKIFSILKVM